MADSSANSSCDPSGYDSTIGRLTDHGWAIGITGRLNDGHNILSMFDISPLIPIAGYSSQWSILVASRPFLNCLVGMVLKGCHISLAFIFKARPSQANTQDRNGSTTLYWPTFGLFDIQ